MKPKNRVMCPDCGRQKMLFNTEKEANTFLKFNGDAINPDGTRELRVYWCPACCGYHISSHEYKGDNKRTDRMIERYKQETGTSIVEVTKLFDKMVKMNFNDRSEMNRWLRGFEGATQKTKDCARDMFYRNGYLKKK